jgi:hypothetical protein
MSHRTSGTSTRHRPCGRPGSAPAGRRRPAASPSPGRTPRRTGGSVRARGSAGRARCSPKRHDMPRAGCRWRCCGYRGSGRRCSRRCSAAPARCRSARRPVPPRRWPRHGRRLRRGGCRPTFAPRHERPRLRRRSKRRGSRSRLSSDSGDASGSTPYDDRRQRSLDADRIEWRFPPRHHSSLSSQMAGLASPSPFTPGCCQRLSAPSRSPGSPTASLGCPICTRPDSRLALPEGRYVPQVLTATKLGPGLAAGWSSSPPPRRPRRLTAGRGRRRRRSAGRRPQHRSRRP